MSAILATADPFALLDVAPAETPVETPAETKAETALVETPKPDPVVEPTPAPVSTTVGRSPRKQPAKTQVVFLDLETVPDFSRYDLFGLPEIPQPAEYMAENEGPTQSELMNPPRLDMNKPATLDDINGAVKAALSKASGKKLRREIVEACIEIEKKSQKPRKGVIDLFSDMVAAIDGEAKMIADAIATNNKAMSVCPEMNKIVAIGWAVGDEPVQSMVVGAQRSDGSGLITELDILDRIWTVIGNANGGPVCGFNVLGFDLPTIFVRSAMNKIKARRKFDLKPWGGDVLDLMALRYAKGQFKGLGWLTKVNGIISEVPDVDGSMVGQLYDAGEFDKIGAYVRDDVALARSYHRMYAGFFW